MSRPPRWMLATLAVGLLALGVAGAWFYLAQRQYLQQVASANLMAVAQAEVDQIVAWRAERLGDAAVLQENPLFTRAVARWLAGHQPGIAADILRRLRSSKDHYRYDDVRLVDRAGRVVLATSGRLGALDAGEAAAVRAAFRDRRATMGEVYLSPGDTIPHLVVVAPLFALDASATEPLGAVVHVVDAQRSLFRLVEWWPSPSPSAEARLVRRDGDSVLFLPPRRFQPDAAPTPRIALSRRKVPAVMAVLGTEGVVRGVDYRGVRVIAALRAVPGTPWFLVAKVDEAEALAVWRTRAALVFAVLLALALVAGAVTVAVGQRSAKAHYRRLYEAEAALRASEARYQLLFDGLTDAVLVSAVGDDGMLTELVAVNDAACQRLGYAREELLRLSVRDVVAPESTVDLEAVARCAKRGEKLLFEQIHVTKDGRRIPVEVHVQGFELRGRPVVLSIARDITERKRIEAALRQSEERFKAQYRHHPMATFAWRKVGEDFALVDFNDAAGALAGEMPMAFVGRRASDLYAQRPEVLQALERSLASGKILTRETQSEHFLPGRHVVTTYASVPPDLVMVYLEDITERKRSEEARRESEERFRELFDHMAEGMAVYKAVDEGQDFVFVDINRAGQSLSQIHLDEAARRRVTELFPAIERIGLLDAFRRVWRTGQPEHHPLTEYADGRIEQWVENYVFKLPSGLIAAIYSDTSEKHRAEEALRESEERYRGIVEQLNDVYYRTDRDGRITMVSPSAAQLYGFTSTSAMIGRPIESLWQNPDQRATMLAAIGESGFVRDFETSAVRADGTPFTVAVSSHHLRDASGAPDGVEGIIRDITERKQAEAALRALARHLDSVREEEHTRIARQIHDELGQALTALRLDLTWVGRKLPKGNTALRRRIDAAVALTDETITVGQRIVGELRPPILDDLGLVPAVEWYAQHFGERSGLRIEVDAGAEEPAVPDRLAIAAYRIVQEALTNVARHAQATHAWVGLGERDGALTVEIRDDGRGIREEAASDPHSFGIAGMRERAATHGGRLTISSAPGAGTTVRATFPPERRRGSRAPR